MSAGPIWFGLRDPDGPRPGPFGRLVRVGLVLGTAVLALVWLRAWGVW